MCGGGKVFYSCVLVHKGKRKPGNKPPWLYVAEHKIFFCFTGLGTVFKNNMNQVSQCPQTHGKKYSHWQYVTHVARWAHAGSHMYVVHISQVRKRAKQKSLVCTWCIYSLFLHTVKAFVLLAHICARCIFHK